MRSLLLVLLALFLTLACDKTPLPSPERMAERFAADHGVPIEEAQCLSGEGAGDGYVVCRLTVGAGAGRHHWWIECPREPRLDFGCKETRQQTAVEP